MSKLFKDKGTLGVIISRMQVPYLTSSHISMIRTVQDRHDRILVLLGVSEKIDNKNPLPFQIRRQMVQEYLRRNDMVMPVRDMPGNDFAWVKFVDSIISCSLSVKDTAILYGGRDSFIPFYQSANGLYKCQELEPEDNDSGTELRKIAAMKVPEYTKATAEALIYIVNQIVE